MVERIANLLSHSVSLEVAGWFNTVKLIAVDNFCGFDHNALQSIEKLSKMVYQNKCVYVNE